MNVDNSIVQEPAAQIARLEVYIAWIKREVALLQAKHGHSERVYVLLENASAARALLLRLLRATGNGRDGVGLGD